MITMKWYAKINKVVLFKLAFPDICTVFQAHSDTLEYLLKQVYKYLNISQNNKFYSKTNNINYDYCNYDGVCSYNSKTDTIEDISESLHCAIKKLILKSIPDTIPYVKDEDKYFKVCEIWMDINNCRLVSINKEPIPEVGYGKDIYYTIDFGVTYSEKD